MAFNTDKLLHGGDYNPEQWLESPKILEDDIRMLKDSHCNVVSLGIFSWSTLEPEEGVFHFEWMENIINRLYENGIRVVLATPSGARPKWLAHKYPEVLRVDPERKRQLFGARHNHCLTSPVYREKVHIIDRKLAEKFGSHPGVVLWHISNEFGGECHCPLCQEAFRQWVRAKYGTVEELNRRWSTTFWSHTYQSFDQVESPSPIGEWALHALNLDWNRFVTEQTCDFIKNEIEAIREGGSTLPVTTNLMYYYDQLNYFRIAKELDIVSWDTYPIWRKGPLPMTASDNAMCHDKMRSLKKMPYIQMESCTTSTNWQSVSKLKMPGLLMAQSMQAIAHGGEGAMYFQIRQSRGASEKFHGAVIDHYGREDTRVFREVTKTGEMLEKIAEVAGTKTCSKVAILYDWENHWAMDDAQGPRNKGLPRKSLMLKIYRGIRRLGLNVDFVDEEGDLTDYKVFVISMGYMFKEGFARKVRAFTENGGTLLVSFWSGIVDDTDRCYLGGTPADLMDVLGIRRTEIDGLYDWEENEITDPGEYVVDSITLEKLENGAGNDKEESSSGCPGNDEEESSSACTCNDKEDLSGVFTCKNLCELTTLQGARPVKVYGKDFYRGCPAVTVNTFGSGKAWYVGTDAEEKFFFRLMKRIMQEALEQTFTEYPEGLEVTSRENDSYIYRFYQSFDEQSSLPLNLKDKEEIIYGTSGNIPPLGIVVTRESKIPGSKLRDI